MNNEKLCCGIDVSQNSLDVAYQNNLGEIFRIKVGNNNKGFETILEHTGTGYHFCNGGYRCILCSSCFFSSWQKMYYKRGECIEDKTLYTNAAGEKQER
jgi:hypothetical protein